MSTGDATAEDRLQSALSERFGHERFRPGQEEVIRSVLEGRDVLVVLPTGAGKSLMYQLPAVLQDGITVVVSPLIALMKDQTDKLERAGVDALTINSGLTGSEKRAAEEAVANGGGEILYVTPERFRDRTFFDSLLERDVSLLVVDEAHCISEWGHDFRPDYMMIGSIAQRLDRPPLLALTATATPEVQDDIIRQLRMRDPVRLILDLIRPNLHLRLIRTVNDERKRAALEQILGDAEGAGIVYFATVRDAEKLHDELGDRFDLAIYHGQLTGRQRREAQDAFMNGEVDAVLATNAFGLGIDKPDIRFVVHYHMPGSLEAYYQEVGRAGRDGRPARIVLTLLKREGAVREHRGGGWERLVDDVARTDLQADLLDYEARREADRRKLESMVAYCRTARCRTRFIMEYFGLEPPPDFVCGHCDAD